jgi:hypothetical protein
LLIFGKFGKSGWPIAPLHPMENPTNRAARGLAVLIALLVVGCADYPVFEDRSEEMVLPHRVPSK